MSLRAVALNGRFSGTLQPTGTQITSFHLFDAIIRSPRDFELVVFADPAFRGVAEWKGIPRTRFVETPFSQWGRARAQLWEQCILPLKVRIAGCGLVHHPMTTCPRWRNGVLQLITVHDLNFLKHPQWVNKSFRWWLSAFAVPAIKKADHIATISDYVLGDVRRMLGIAVEKSSRVYNGHTPLPFSGEETPRSKVILGVNLWPPHKNLPRLIEAFTALHREEPALELHLLGRPHRNYRAEASRELLERPGIRVLGYLTEQQLAAAYAGASVVCYPSLEEGFGLPILEAMSAGAPVVTSNTSCLPEIAGGAAVLVDPLSVENIAAGIREILHEAPPARTARIARGKEVAAGFTWQAAAVQYLAIYEKLLQA